MSTTSLQALRQFPRQLESLFASVPPAHWHFVPASWDGMPSERLDPVGQICHVRDIEVLGYQQRLARMMAESAPFLPGLDSDALAVANNYRQADPLQALAAFARARQATVELLFGLSDSQWLRQAQFEGYGLVNARAMVHFLCSHDQQHLAGLHWLLGQMACATPPQAQ